MSSPVRVAALALLALLALNGAACGGGRDATEKQLSELRAEIVKLRSDHAVLAERLDGVDLARGTFSRGEKPAPIDEKRGASATSATSAKDGDRPVLDIVRLGPATAPESEPDDPDAKGPRPVLKVTGDGQSKTVSKKPPAKPGTAKKP